jgi:hypothetical protein
MSCHLSMNLMELVVALTTQLDFCHNSKKKIKLPIEFFKNCQKNVGLTVVLVVFFKFFEAVKRFLVY